MHIKSSLSQDQEQKYDETSPFDPNFRLQLCIILVSLGLSILLPSFQELLFRLLVYSTEITTRAAKRNNKRPDIQHIRHPNIHILDPEGLLAGVTVLNTGSEL